MPYCDKHNNPEEHKPMNVSNRGGYYCPNKEINGAWCTFLLAPEYQPRTNYFPIIIKDGEEVELI